ncbi:MAG: EamA family transporter RarD [Cyanobacteria bacterium P01_G01_bin.54]
MPSSSLNPIGIFYALLAYGSWGLLPIYWKLFGDVPAVEVLSHRMIWSLVFLLGLLVGQQRWGEFRAALGSPPRLRILLLTATLIACNWGIYIYGVNSDRVVETSLGYYINPLVTVLLGTVILRERLNRVQWVAVGLATVGVLHFIWNLGQVPWIALGLALSFAFYGLLRKVTAVAPMVGLAVETGAIAPVLLVLVGYWQVQGVGQFGSTLPLTLAFMGAGIVTSMPLLWFNNAAQRLPLSALGFLQYIAPSLALLLGVFLYQEPFTHTHAVTFGCIWLALGLYSVNLWWQQRCVLRQVK